MHSDNLPCPCTDVAEQADAGRGDHTKGRRVRMPGWVWMASHGSVVTYDLVGPQRLLHRHAWLQATSLHLKLRDLTRA